MEDLPSKREGRVSSCLPFLLILLAALASLPVSANVASPPVQPVDAPRGPGLLEDLFAELAARVPAFGGMFLDGNVLKVYLTGPAQMAAAEPAIVAVFGRERIPAGGIQILQGEFSFVQLRGWHNRLGPLFDIQGVVFTDLDERINRLKVAVTDDALFGIVEQEALRLGIPRHAFVMVKTEPIVFAASLLDRMRPIEGGIQIAFSGYLCTLGFNAIRASDGVQGFVVNSHCTNTQGGVESTNHYQPTVASENLIGTEIADPTYTTAKCPPGLTGYVCRYSDSAFSQRDSGVSADLGLIARPGSVNTGSLTVAGTFRIVAESSSLVGEVLGKVGRTTGWTQGQVTSTCVNVGVSGTNIAQLCQDIVSAGVGAGDSGSPVFFVTNSQYDVELRGILWGSSGTSFVYSPIANIERADELGQLATQSTATATTTVTLTTTQSSTLYSFSTTTRTVTSYTRTTTSTSTIPTLTTVVLVPLTITSTARSTQFLTSFLTTTVTSYTGTQTATSTIPTTVALVPLTMTSAAQSTQYLTSILTTTVTSYTATTTSTSTSVVYTTVTNLASAGASSPLVYLGFASLFVITVGRFTTGRGWRIPKVRSLMGRRCSRS